MALWLLVPARVKALEDRDGEGKASLTTTTGQSRSGPNK